MIEPHWRYAPDVKREVGGFSVRYWRTKTTNDDQMPVVIAIHAPGWDTWICGGDKSTRGSTMRAGRCEYHENLVADGVMKRIRARGGLAQDKPLKRRKLIYGYFENPQRSAARFDEMADTCAALAAVLRQSEVKR